MIQYDKLIRDNIPEIIESSGKKCIVAITNNVKIVSVADYRVNPCTR